MESNFSSKFNNNGFEYYDVSFLPNHSTPPNLEFGVPSSSDFDLFTNHLVPTTTQDQDHHPDENALLRYVNQLLMEEESIMEEKQSIFYDSLALQQTEEMLQQVIRDPQSQSCLLPTSISSEYRSSSNETEVLYDPQGSVSVMQFKRGLEEASKFLPNTDQWIFNLEQESNGAKKNLREREEEEEIRSSSKQFAENVEYDYSRARKNLREREEEEDETRSSKQFAENVEESKLTKLFDKVLLLDNKSDPQIIEDNNDSRKIQTRGKKKNQAIDFRTLLTLCAQSISTGDKITSDDLLKKIRKRCTPLGDATQRLAYFFANALEARLEGNKMIKSYYESMRLQKRRACEILKAYRVFLSSSPFMTLIYFFSNKMIYDASKDASVLHIIDFGILYGWQWPMFIQYISKTKTGPKKLRITGIELPQQGFRPTERIEDTGQRLAEYCKRFQVPFEYNAIASKNWETIKNKDFKIRPNEVLAVNSVLRFKNLQDVTSSDKEEDCPRDRFLKLIRDLNPNIFLISTINGSFNAPFFTTRFKEALFHYSSLFDMFDSTLSRDNSERIYFEGEFYGREVMNVIACEGVDRVERPESYKQWQVRMIRAGFRQKVVEDEVVEMFREKMKNWGYHKDFVLDEDCNWFLQGWKGRILFSSSCWIPS